MARSGLTSYRDRAATHLVDEDPWGNVVITVPPRR